MKLVIVKAKITDKISFLKRMHDSGHDFGKVVFQNDRVFLPRGYQPSRKLPKLMIRTEIIDPKRKPWYQLIQKRHLTDQNIDLVHMTPILDYTETAHIVQQLGFELRAEVVRNRQKLQVDDVTFYLDDVDELGTYVKLERELKKDEDIEKIRRELWEVLKVLGVDKSNAEPDTYTAQLLKK
ncbi:CYTH domain-containing protein [Candidatus Saccharibacteria bacterium]|jgi:predicted adenylyl cyclase CyaB|nr:CYTH domain-containing protein [Candidatus Saccharibacteria bacterium]